MCTGVERVFTHVILGLLATSLCVYVCVFVEGIYICKTGPFGNKPLFLCFFCFRRYVHI